MLRSARLFVEAKGLEQDLKDNRWVNQNLAYAAVAGVEWCVLTNGDEYCVYNAHAIVPVEQKLAWDVRVSDAAQHDHVLDTLELLSKEKIRENIIGARYQAHLVDRKVNEAVDDLFKAEDKSLIRLIRRKTTGLSPLEIRSSLKRAAIRIDFPLVSSASADSTVQSKEGPSRPKKFRNGKKSPKAVGVELRNLIEEGSITPPLQLEREYKGRQLRATVQQDGTVMVDGKTYGSPSTAAAMARKSVIGAPKGRKYPQTNGWTFWRYLDPEEGRLRELDVLRQRFLKTSC